MRFPLQRFLLGGAGSCRYYASASGCRVACRFGASFSEARGVCLSQGNGGGGLSKASTSRPTESFF